MPDRAHTDLHANLAAEPQRRSLHLLYHELHTGPSPYSYALETARFEQHLDLYLRLRNLGARETLRPEITFDDGHRSNFEYALPRLQARKLQAHFFITAGWTGQRPEYMTWPQLRELHSTGQSIGAHGWSHVLLTHCSEAELKTELLQAKLALEDGLGTAITTISLPGGRSNRRVLAACAEAGYESVYTSEPRSHLRMEPRSHLSAQTRADLNTIGRVNIRGDVQSEWLEQLLHPDGPLLKSLGRSEGIKTGLKSLMGDRVYARLWALLNRQQSEARAAELSPP